MGEAIFAKYSKGGVTISNSTKQLIGLSNNANLDDIIKSLGQGSPNYGTVKVTLKDIDGSVLPNHKIRIVDAYGVNYAYTTDGAGQCTFKTNSGQATLYDDSNNIWFDVGYPVVEADPIIGSVKNIEMKRYKKWKTSDIINIQENCTINFSKYADKLDAVVRGESGQGGSACARTNYMSKYVILRTLHLGFNDTECLEFWRYTNNNNGALLGLNWNLNSGILNNNTEGSSFLRAMRYFRGGNGGLGNINQINNVEVQNKNFTIITPSQYKKSFDNHTRYSAVFGSININDSGCHIYLSASQWTARAFIGNTGGTSSAFGISASGGIFGREANQHTGVNGVNQGTGEFSGFPGENVYCTFISNGEGYVHNNVFYAQNFHVEAWVYLETGNSCPGQVTISNFRYK